MSLIAFSGGINSRFVVILPLLPIMMCLMLNTTSSALLTAVLLTYIISVSALHPYLPEFIINISNPQEHFPRTLWLFLVTLLSFAFAKMYSDINSKLTIQLKDQRSHEDTYELYSQDAVLSYADNLLLKINSLKSTDNHLTLMLIDYCEMQSGEPLLPNSLNERRREDISNVIKKVFNHTTDIIGQCDDGKFIVCRHTQDLNAPLKSANSIEQHALKLSLDVNIGYISVAGNIGIDISSIFSLANKALEKSKTKNVPNIVNFRDIKSL
ncbi:hypothetical protein KJ365_01505 [Glaciecola sp. XM2]|uniref:hypothetical protein n=1 Tax=Glaciecola sp. XM2 TaxID=1914931 RepID=UPI001BDE94EF|nr:hypothetical protein [Glaciecola sp. XM2]MBT1449543.1 hypothetical protein [Glaciecola sp. XM2]